MKTLDVSWAAEETVAIDIAGSDATDVKEWHEPVADAAVAPGNLIVITCSGGVLRQWPRS